MKAQKSQITLWKCQDYGYFVMINSRMLLLRLVLRINVANYFQDQRRHSNCRATVMFRGTPYI